jgi:protein TonB
MDTRNLDARVAARGAIRPMMLAVIAVFVALAVAAWFLIIQPHEETLLQDAGGHPSTPVSSGVAAAPPPPANVEAMGTDQLLAEARRAMNEQRYLAPAGNNAFEFYLKALQKQPGNPAATDALRETYPFAATAAEQTINGGDFNEAQREIDLLAKADPANYTLTILRSKLDAQRKLQDQQQAQAQAQQKQQQLAAQKAADEKAAEEQQAQAQQKAQAEAQQRSEQTRLAQQRSQTAPAPTTPAAAQAPAQASGDTEPVLVKSVQPRYPTQARRANQEGWVDVEYDIDADGNVTDVRVVGAQPHHVFEREATDAVGRWKFTPATHDGTPVASKRQQRIIFKLQQ